MIRAVCLLWLTIASGAVATPRSPIVEQVESAQRFASRCEFGRAIDIGEAALKLATRDWPLRHPGLMALHLYLSGWYNSRLQPVLAEQHARRALELTAPRNAGGELTPPAALAAQNLGVALIGQHRYREADERLAAALRTFEAAGAAVDIVNAQLALAGLEFARGNQVTGSAHAEKAVENLRRLGSEPGFAFAAWLRVADARRRRLDFDGAQDALEAARQLLAWQAAGQGGKRLLLTDATLAFERNDLRQSLELLALADAEPADPCDPVLDADIAHRRGVIHLVRREVPEARFAFGQGVDVLRSLDLQDSARFGEALYGLAVASGFAGETDVSEGLFNRAIRTFRTSYGGGTSAEAQALIELAFMQTGAGRTGPALANAQKAVQLLSGQIEQLPLDKVYAEATLGRVLKDAGNYAQARSHLVSALGAFATARGESSFDLVPGLVALAEIDMDLGNLDAAEPRLRRALAIQQQGGWTGAQAIGVTRSRLAKLLQVEGKPVEALAESERAVTVLEQRLLLGEERPWADAEAERRRARDITEQDLSLVTAGLAPGELTRAVPIIDRVMRSGQLAAGLRTGAAIAQMAERLSLTDDTLGRLVRERSDLVAELQLLGDRMLAELTAAPDDVRRRDKAVLRQTEIIARLQVIDVTLDRQYGRASLVLKSPVANLSQVQSVLRAHEAVMAFFVTTNRTYVVAMTAMTAAAYPVDIDRLALADIVKTLRPTHDPGQLLPGDSDGSFDRRAAYDLYQKLVAPALAIVGRRRALLVVADGPLMSLPFSLLQVRPPPATNPLDDYRDAPWLIRERSVSTLPSLAALVALRRLVATQPPSDGFLGIGAPVLIGGGDRLQQGSIDKFTSRLADPDLLRTFDPLLDAAGELRRIADSLGRVRSKLLLADEAREDVVRSMAMDQYGTIAFATHGLVTGELAGYGQPALMLTPPKTASDTNDGLLSASEIAGLHLNADWVILSACSTAAGDGRYEAEPLTGLAKAFFYAGARSLLLTNWTVNSDAAVDLSRNLFTAFKRGHSRSAALRVAQLKMISDRDRSGHAHPFYWASFSIIGS